MLKAFATQHKLERSAEALQTALPIAETLKNHRLVQFVMFCSQCIDEETLKKKDRSISQVSSSSRSSKASTNLETPGGSKSTLPGY